jgi:hypothetical protein
MMKKLATCVITYRNKPAIACSGGRETRFLSFCQRSVRSPCYDR